MKTVTATDFKNRAAELINEVSSSGKPILVTRRGRPVVRVDAVENEPKRIKLGAMRSTGKILGDIVSPVFDEWESVDPNEGSPSRHIK